jgi:uncharacterized protein YwgA
MELSRAQLLMMLLAAPGPRGANAEPIQGTTRLQKLLFLLESEGGLKANTGPDFNFTAYKFGPVSKDLYDDLEKLENLGLLEADTVAEASEAEADETNLAFDDLMGSDEEGAKEIFEEKKFKLTQQGIDWLKRHVDVDKDLSVLETVRKVKGKYGALSLQDLLRYVYTRYPAMTTASEIKGRVLGHG